MSWTAIGFEKQKKYFQNVIKNGKLSHAYLLTGPAMIGKKKFAMDLCWLINKDAQIESEFKYFSPREDEGESKIYIEDVRDLKAFMSFRPANGAYKFVVINDAHALTTEASNALLKILEEPPASSILFLVTSKPSFILPTIISRCQRVDFLPHDVWTISQFLSSRKVAKDDAELITFLAQGRLGWATTLLESDKLSGIKKSIRDFQNVIRQGTFERMQYAKKIISEGNYSELMDIWIRWIRAYGKNPIKTRLILKDLIQLHHLVSQPQFNHQLALENFLINI